MVIYSNNKQISQRLKETSLSQHQSINQSATKCPQRLLIPPLSLCPLYIHRWCIADSLGFCPYLLKCHVECVCESGAECVRCGVELVVPVSVWGAGGWGAGRSSQTHSLNPLKESPGGPPKWREPSSSCSLHTDPTISILACKTCSSASKRLIMVHFGQIWNYCRWKSDWRTKANKFSLPLNPGKYSMSCAYGNWAWQISNK